MKKTILLEITVLVIMGFVLMSFGKWNHIWAQPQLEFRQSVERKFEEYRRAIKDAHQIDIKNFQDKIPGGLADGRPITNYDLGQLIEGIKWERVHTKDNMLALELAMDHLESIPDYYTRIARLEREYLSEEFRDM